MTSCTKAAVAALVFAVAAVLGAASPSRAGPVLLFEATSGRVLYAEDQDDRWYPASLTKIMTAYLAFEALKAGRLKPDDVVTVSEAAAVQAPSKLGLPVGTEIPAELAIRALIVKSANDAAVMLAEKIGGTEEDFVKLMNDTAKRLGMTRTRFVNPNGLPVPGQVTTARDLARLARAVLKDFPEHQALWAQSEVRVGRHRLKSHNALLRSFEGADGIKTGFICDSGFNVVASATRDGRRLIAVVLGEPSGRDRNLQAAGLLDHGFETYDWKVHFGTATLDSMPTDPAADEVVSVRASVTAWACNPRPARRVVKRKPGAVATKKGGGSGRSAKAPEVAETGSAAGAAPAAKPTRAAKAAPAPAPAPASTPARKASP